MLNKKIMKIENELTGLVSYLVNDGILDAETARSVLHATSHQPITAIHYLIRSDILSSEKILEYCANKFELPKFDLRSMDVAFLKQSIIKPDFIRRYRVIPLKSDKSTLLLGITDPTDSAAISAIKFHTGLSLLFALISDTQLDEIINLYYRPNILYSQIETTLSKMMPIEDTTHKLNPKSDLNAESQQENDEPVISFVDSLIKDAIDKNISDIHIEPHDEHTRIRFRRDGALYEAATIPHQLSTRICMRLKIMASMNIAERRLPQDGRIQLQDNSKIDIRINTCPTLHNEKIVLRILDTKKVNIEINTLGFTTAQKSIFLEKIIHPQGLILVTGPTGSGKTMTLYTALQHLNKIEKNICTIEDPIEIELSGINQVNINPKIGFNFATALHAFLRQDPDIIMVGEIRDLETANIAIQAAQTGHLVLSTLHTNSAIESFARLQAMGIATYNIMQSVILIIAQRLVRKLCEFCKQVDTSSHSYQARGCEHCHHGYKGRVGIFEMVVNGSEHVDDIKLWDAGLAMVNTGMTSYAEIERVVGRKK